MEKKNNVDGYILSDAEKKLIDDCPHDIINVEKFLKHCVVVEQCAKIQYFTASDGTVVNLKTPNSKLPFKIKHLEEKEQERILRKRKVYNSLNTKQQNFFRSAIGAYKDGKSTTTHEKLMTEKKAELLEYFGRFYTIDEVHTITRKDWGTTYITKEVLSHFFKDNFDEIARLREKHKEDFDHLRLTHKASRIEELMWMYNKLKLKYETSSNREDHRTLLQTIESIRKEVEGDRLTIQANVDINIQEEVNLQIRNELMKTIPLREIIIGRISARMEISPRELIGDMNKSYYARMNRLLEDTDEIEFEELGFPSEQSYDFEAIGSNHKQNEENKIRNKEIKEAEKKRKENSEATAKNEALKEKLLAKLKNKIANNKEANQQLKDKMQ